jgi:hypothetical protein
MIYTWYKVFRLFTLRHADSIFRHSHHPKPNTIKQMTSVKGPSPSTAFDGSPLRIAIVHANWNKQIIDALLKGAIAKLRERGVAEKNIVVQSVPGSFELPFACSK